MNKQKRIEELLQEKRISYADDVKDVEGNRVGGLYELIQEWFEPDFVVVEIGSCEGSSTELFALTCQRVFAVDPWDGSVRPNAPIEIQNAQQSEKKCRERMAKYDNVQILKGFSEEMVSRFPNKSLDAVYIDGAHDAHSVNQDIDMWLPKIKETGVLCGHDWSCAHISRMVKRKFGYADKDYKDASWAVDLKRFYNL